MDQWDLLNLAISLIVVTPLAMAAWLGWVFRRHVRPPLWPILLLLFVSFGAVALLIQWGGPGGLWTIIVLVGLVSCFVVALVLTMRKTRGWSCSKSLLLAVTLVAPLLVWADLRFCVIIEDSQGQPVEVKPAELKLCYSATWVYYEQPGARLKKGVIYFGILHWLQNGKRWYFWGDLISPDGKYYPHAGKIDGGYAEWSKWPYRFTTNPEAARR